MTVSSATASVTAELHRRYFTAPEMDDCGMSSHWRAFAPRSTVTVDAEGVPTTAAGAGFGDMNVARPGNAVLTPLAAILHGIGHPARGRLPAAIAETRRVTRRAGLVFNQDALRQAFTLALLADRLAVVSKPSAAGRGLRNLGALRRIVMIGDGYGVLGAALATAARDAQVVFIDLGRSLLFQALTCGRVFPDAAHALVGRESAEAIAAARFVYCPVDRLDALPIPPTDLAVNVASMQEMAPAMIARYFSLLRHAPAQWFYCCNRERKAMPGGEVSEFMKYPWDPADEHVVDGLCPWHQWYLAFRRGRGLLAISLRSRYDGPHLHRLTRLAPAARSES